ncbi:MAG TPA: trypsin-like peptidase domain-containing protein [Oligoflexus sp.]|uniref:trypsin-like peptidase domain-containing protein n=1 Tax=Oligoflexus sp. TaxID=1971216 RepID=UPI002D80FCC9|nr:trypsin-like peptidase domain-containing protein [Oligoflexus sp.]HET9238428.1 trypsin-like peptidase domain-containing protein [Oligoflexus sp.]
MLRPWSILISVFVLSCKSLPHDRHASAQFMRMATESKATRLLATADTRRLFQAMARVDSDQSCSGVLIGKDAAPDSPAYLLTAGHCLMDLEDIRSSQRIFRDALPRSDRNAIHFERGDFRIGRVLYATMKGVDLAIAEITEDDNAASIFRLTERQELDAEDARAPRALTLRQLKERGIEPLPWAKKLPEFGDQIRIISAAVDDETDADILREHRCRHEGLADVIESIWHWHGVARNNCDDILPGASGAPVLNKDAALFAIVNTSSRNALSQDCYLGQPCELTEKSFQVAAARNYGTLVLHLPSCFNAQGNFAPEEPRCTLERRGQATVLSQIPTPLNPGTRTEAEREWGVTLQPVDSGSRGFHYKTVSLPMQSCQQMDGYSERLPWPGPDLRKLPAPLSAGLYALCIVSEKEYENQDLRHAAMIILNVDNQAPQLKPRLVTQPNSQEPLMAVRKSCRNLPLRATFEQRRRCAVAVLSLEIQPYEIVDFYHGLVDGKAQDCRSVKNENRGAQLSIPVDQLPASLCVWAVDGAGNRSEEPVILPIRAANRREIIEATDVMADWSFQQP